MFNFDFYNPTRIVFGKGRITDLNKYIPQQARVLVLYGGGSVKTTGTLTEVLHALGDRVVSEFAGIEPNPSYETLMQAVEVVRREKIDFLLVGGGSVIDGTKFVAAASLYEVIASIFLKHAAARLNRHYPLAWYSLYPQRVQK